MVPRAARSAAAGTGPPAARDTRDRGQRHGRDERDLDAGEGVMDLVVATAQRQPTPAKPKHQIADPASVSSV